MIAPLRYSFEVECSVEHAFDVWTARTSTWWPQSSTMSQADGLEVIFEGRTGGRIFERTPSGQEIDWGAITVWEPPRRLGYSWHIATDAVSATEVEIRFSDLGDEKTRVDIEHRGWEKLGERGPGWRDTNRGGWEGTLPFYVAACASTRRNAG
jgi:hypothetical protein